MAVNTIGIVPANITDPTILRQFLSILVERLDSILDNGAEVLSATVADLKKNLSEDSIVGTEREASIPLTKRVSTVEKLVAELTGNLNQDTIADPVVTTVAPSATYVQSEAIAVADNTTALELTVLAILTALKNANIIV